MQPEPRPATSSPGSGRTHIARLVEEHGRARVARPRGPVRRLAVTIRKDLVALEAERPRSSAPTGAPSRPTATSRSCAFDIRERLQADEKERDRAAAAALVHDGESDRDGRQHDGPGRRPPASRPAAAGANSRSSPTACGSPRSWPAPGITVLMLGGRVRWEALSVVGQLGDGLFSRINVQTAFIGAAGFTLESGLSDATDEEAQIKRSMVAAAREVIAIVDHTKWQRAAFATFCPTDEMTSSSPTPRARRMVAERERRRSASA